MDPRIATLAAVAVVLSTPAGAGLTEAWRVGGFDLPESVSYDDATQSFFVSNLGTNPTDKDGNGFISRLDARGNLTELKWVTGLNAPKGTAIADGKLYVTDIDQLVVIDIASRIIVNRYPGKGAKFLNDPAVAPDGRVFVADTFANAIYVLDNGGLQTWRQDPSLMGPNGLLVRDGTLIVAELGDVSQGFENIKPGTVKQIDLATKAISDFGPPAPLAPLDGIEDDGEGGVMVTDNPGGRLLDIKAGEPPVVIGTLAPGAADFEWVPSMNLLVVPQMQQNEIVAYSLTD
jgi:DNA-binding beta-propeller fold protein YncE